MYLELRHLRSLLAIDQTGNLARAAERLHLTQSALSHQIRSLEQYYETALFLRGSKPLRLTPAGQRLLALAEQVLPQVTQLEADLRRVAEGRDGRLYIAIECHACFEWLAPVLDRFRRQWPDIEVDISTAVSFEAVPALLSGQVDLVISSDPVKRPDLHFAPLFRYEALLALPEGHRLTGKRRVHPQDLADETLITYPVQRQRLDVFKRFLEPAGVEPAAVRQAELTAVILLLVASGRGLAVLPDWVLDEAARATDLQTRPLGRRGLKGALHAGIRDTERTLPFMQDFIRLARACKLAD